MKLKLFSYPLLYCLLSSRSARAHGLRRRDQATDSPIYGISYPEQQNDPIFANLNIPANAAEAGMWTNVFSTPLVAIHASVLPDGRVAMYGAPPGGDVQDGRVFVFWDPKQGTGSGAFAQAPNAQGVDSFCSSGLLMSDGRFYVSGGGSYTTGINSKTSSIVDWRNRSTPSVVRAEDLNRPRWYGTMTKLPDGRFLFSGGGVPYANGLDGREQGISSTPEVYTEGQGWRLLNNARSIDAYGGVANRWWYPRQWVAPSGTIFGISANKIWELDVNGEGSVRTIRDFKELANDQTRPNIGCTSTAVMYDQGKVLQVGGNGYSNGFRSQSSRAATTFDINNLGAGVVDVQETQPMNFPRQWANAIVLPDGKVLVSGGSRFSDSAGSNAVLQPEIWDPSSGRWSLGSSMSIYRGYHSTATLLPNGAVFVGGGGIPGPVRGQDAQVYLPPNLFERSGGRSVFSDRPKIISISANTLDYGSTAQVQLSAGTVVTDVSLISLPTVTHSFDSNQRRLRPRWRNIANGIEFTVPTSGNIAPPGYYYLSVVNTNGVPSVAVIVSIASAAPPVPAQAPADGAVTFGSSEYRLGTPNLTWDQARAEAESQGGKILEVDSAAENDFVVRTFGGRGPIWLGLNDQAVEGSFVNSDGSAPSFTNWLPDEPNDFGGRQDYACIASADGRWDDVTNEGGWAFIDGAFRGGQTNQLVIEISKPAAGRIVTFGSSEYRLGSPNLTWDQARAEAESQGGKILEVDSAAENDFVVRTFGGRGPIWLGLNDQAVEGSFVNSDGSAPSFTNWLPGQPDNFGGDQDYAYIASVDGRWDDVNNAGGFAFIDGGYRGGQTNQLVIEIPLKVTFGSSEYRLGTPNLTWDQARVEAESQGGKILEVDSAAENDFVVRTFGGRGPIWLGLNDQAVEGSFVNSDGSAPSFTNWLPGQPDNFGGDQDYAYIASADGRWDDVNNAGGFAFIDGGYRGGQTNQLVIEIPLKVTFGSSEYRLGTPNLTWDQARVEAESQGGKILEVDSAAENDFVVRTFGGRGPIWLGLNDQAVEGSFVNSDGSAPSFTNWLPDEPNDFGGRQDYACIASADGRWDDVTNEGGWAFIDGAFRGGQTNQLVIEIPMLARK